MRTETNLLALVLAGGEGNRLYPLTAEHAKPAVGFVDGYRIIDFVLSNLVNSKISTIYVIAQYKPDSLIRHIDAVWGRRGTGAGSRIQVLLPRSDNAADRFKGTADAVYRNLGLIARHRPEVVAVFAADHVYRMDVRQMVDAHLDRRAYVTVAAVPMPIEKARSFGVMVTDANGRITLFQEKPERPAPMPTDPTRAYGSMGNYLFDPDVLAGLLHRARKNGGTDFGRDVLPALARCPRVFAYDFASNQVPGVQAYEETAYWRDVGTIDALKAAQDDASGFQPRFNLGNPRWPIHRGHNSSRGL
ncbi:MAG: glucose-1-phosphate adenylyltransferase [Betaproteobacteria bacterium]|nr:MAG: glucose-1-phosphate adenylyltransferase [Betaproteobacteria bacterium]